VFAAAASYLVLRRREPTPDEADPTVEERSLAS
jgi:hypothetical protein